jgi:hypothetical protein
MDTIIGMKRKKTLTKSQKSALHYINKYAHKHKKEAVKEIKEILLMSNNSLTDYYLAVENIKKCAQVGIHFHPDRPDKSLKPTIENLFEQGIYKNQFETHISSGGLSGYKGGERDKWEKYLFGSAYNKPNVKNNERPKYGALDLMRYPDGPSPRFGSCYFLLYPEVSQRCTFTYMGSHLKPRERGTLEEFDFILMRLLCDTFHYNNTLGEQNISVRNLLNHFNENLKIPIDDLSDKEAKRNLNHCIEAQIHGSISLKDDVKIFVADPSFLKTSIGDVIIKTCEKYSIKLLWHMGFAMKADDVPDDFRGNKMPELAKRIAVDNSINAHTLGLAAMDLYTHPEEWENWGSKNAVIQEIKLMWHILVKYGKKTMK